MTPSVMLFRADAAVSFCACVFIILPKYVKE